VWLGWNSQPAWTLVLTAAALAGAVLGVGWRGRWPRSFERWVIAPVQGRRWRGHLRSTWPQIAASCGLAERKVPPVVRLRRDWPRIELVVRPVMGQTYADFEKAGEAIRLAVGASQIRVEPSGACEVSMVFTLGDALGRPFDAVVPDGERTDRVLLGRRADGEAWWLPVGPHTLVAGCSGSGKGSVFWSFAFGLAPAVRSGRVQLHGIDLKGGMEILMGRRLFSSCATTPAQAVAVLEQLVAWMEARTRADAGRLRAHTATVEEPLHVVMIDELAALTAYCPDRELQRRAENAINLLCSQGRAPGFMVFACLQDPRKEVIPSRGLFTQMIGLRLKDLSETTMVLGEVAVLSGAHCHRITRDVPGTGYVVPEDGGHPIRVRAGYASDDRIRQVATDYGTSTIHEVDATGIEQELAARQERRSRSIGGAA
jgi:S-DNA-T family DNA segregation ATPase FtsK/SpoIIIE